MDDFSDNFLDAFKRCGLKIKDEENGKEVSDDEFLDYVNQHTLYKIGDKWYTRDSVFFGDYMIAEYADMFIDDTIIAEELAYYMLTDCIVSGLCIAQYDSRYGIFPLEERNGMQSGIWSCKGEPFIYDDVKVYADWQEWCDYGYVSVKKDGKWGVIKVTQFPEPDYALVAELQYATPELAMKAIGVSQLPTMEAFKKVV